MEQPPVSQYLDAINAKHKVFEHDVPIGSLEQAAEERNLLPDQIVRSILFRRGNGKYLLVCVSGPKQIDWKSLRKYLGVSRITMASPEEVWNQTGYEIGTVAPFGLRPDLSILIDKHILDHEVISFGSGRKQSAIIMETNEFCKHLENHTAIEFIR